MSEQKEPQEKYFVVERSQLGVYGDENGCPKQTAQDFLDGAARADDLVVIKGILIEPRLVLD